MKITKVYATVFWVIIVVVLFGLFKYVIYKVDMYYANLAPQQLEDDSAYGLMKFHGTVEGIVWIIYGLFFFLVVRVVYNMWFSKDKKKDSDEKSQ